MDNVLGLLSCQLSENYIMVNNEYENLCWLFTEQDVKRANENRQYRPQGSVCYKEGGNSILRSDDGRILIGVDHVQTIKAAHDVTICQQVEWNLRNIIQLDIQNDSLNAEQFQLLNHRSLYTSEIADALGIVKSTVYKYLVAMNDRGMLSYRNGEIVTERTNKISLLTKPAAVLGSVSCGMPQLEEEYIEEYVSLPVSLFGEGEFFILRASGDL